MMMMRCNGFPAMPPDGGSATYLQQLNVVCRGANKNENFHFVKPINKNYCITQCIVIVREKTIKADMAGVINSIV